MTEQFVWLVKTEATVILSHRVIAPTAETALAAVGDQWNPEIQEVLREEDTDEPPKQIKRYEAPGQLKISTEKTK